MNTKVQVELTPREAEVLTHIMLGQTNKEAARDLYVSTRTVDFHVRNINAKLGTRNRVGLFRAAIRHGYYTKEVQA